MLRFAGAIRFSDTKFYGTCNDPRHGRCVCTRTNRPGRKAAQGRPLGFLAAWLLSHEDFPTQNDYVYLCSPSLALRKKARRDLARSPNLGYFLEKERHKGDDEESEPEGLP